jgi:hypothetical protein
MKPPRAGETVGLRRGQNGQPAGLHLVREVLEDGRLAVTSWRSLEEFIVPSEDVVGADGEPVTVAPRPLPSVEPRPRRQESPPGQPVVVHVIHRTTDVEIFSRYFGRTVHYTMGRVVGRRKDGQEVRAFEVDSNDVQQFVHDLDPIAYLPGNEPLSVEDN